MQFYVSRFAKAMELIAELRTLATEGIEPLWISHSEIGKKIDLLAVQLEELGLSEQARRARHLAGLLQEERPGLPGKNLLADLELLVYHDMNAIVFEAVPRARSDYYEKALEKWGTVTARFPCASDIEEAGKCFALGRFTASVFHLMRVTECAVLELQCFLDRPDPKAHFGSVLQKLENLHRKTDFKDISEHLRPYRDFLIDTLSQLHAVKDSWRNKVCHVDGKIVPVDVFSEEMAAGIYAATLLLMKKLAAGLPQG